MLAFWTRLELDPEVTALIRELRAAGAACFLATNQHELRRAYMSTSLGYDELLDGQLYSCDLGVAKPDPAYFTAALEQHRLRPPASALFIDDREANVLGARTRRAARRGLPPLLRRRRAARHHGGARPAAERRDSRTPASGGSGTGGLRSGGGSRGPPVGTAQSWMPSRRAERARWRVARSRRSRLTSIGSASSAAGVSMRVLSTW